uniref:Uncharacterized protein n=1 Tax=Ditylenchus dipsaci TaxID=166011 RepID=A0A915D7H6_9BILA
MKDFTDNEADYESSDEEEMESEEEDDDSESNLSNFLDDEESGTSIRHPLPLRLMTKKRVMFKLLVQQQEKREPEKDTIDCYVKCFG